MAYPSNYTSGVPTAYQGNLTWVSDPAYQGGGYYAAYDRGIHYSYAQLEKLWMDAGGDPTLASDMAAIADSQSGGYVGAWNSSGATGLYQIEYPDSAPKNSKGKPSVTRQQLFNPLTNTKAALRLEQQSGFAPWGGVPSSFVQNNVAPSKSVPSISANNAGSNAQTTSFTSSLGSATAILTDLSSADLWERIGLGMLGAMLVLIGIIIVGLNPTIKGGGAVVGSILGVRRTARAVNYVKDTVSPSQPAPRGPTPEQIADRSKRLFIAEEGMRIGRMKAETAAAKERRLQLNVKPKKHSSGSKEPNPAPPHN